MDLSMEAPLSADMIFEGPEKKLEAYFRSTVSPDGLRRYPIDTWSEVLEEAACTILSVKGNDEFDAYLLSESSLFVFPYRVVIKTCGTTTLLLVIPKLLSMVEQMGSSLELLQYGHLRYKFPEQQVYPHASFAEERAYLVKQFGEVNECALGPCDCCWSMLSVSKDAPAPLPNLSLGLDKPGDDILEIAMEGLALDVCSLFCRGSVPREEEVYGDGAGPAADLPVERELGNRMTIASGLRALLPMVDIDDWAFEPCGYSMNGLRDGFYYTVHITPEPAFSYASFETNDPAYRDQDFVRRIVGAFAPSLAVVTLTTRRSGCKLPAYSLPGFDRSALDFRQLGAAASVCCATFASQADQAPEAEILHAVQNNSLSAPLEQCGEWLKVA